jgi:hypothetical protein
MSKTTIVSGCVCVGIVVLGAACATGGGSDADSGGTVDAAVSRVDASPVVTPDAGVKLDGGLMTTPDAFVSQTPDAGGTQLFCTTNSQCTVSGECCLTLGGPQGFCAPGVVVLGECVPN